MKLSELLHALPDSLAATARTHAAADPTIRGLSIDSRTVSPGDLFVALCGELADAHAWLADAAKAGAVALLVERAPAPGVADALPIVVVPDTRRAPPRRASSAIRRAALVGAGNGDSGVRVDRSCARPVVRWG